MLFMDWRDDHLAQLPEIKARNDKLPTFLYAMPFSKTKVGKTACVAAWCRTINARCDIAHQRSWAAFAAMDLVVMHLNNQLLVSSIGCMLVG
jgi:hypothetical protein